jgi:hypothetical protein
LPAFVDERLRRIEVTIPGAPPLRAVVDDVMPGAAETRARPAPLRFPL